MYLDYLISLYMFMMISFVYSFYFKHLLLMMINLEFLVVILIYNLYLILIMFEMNMYLYIFMMSMMVCEGVLGLSLIVVMVRLHGNDYINSLSLVKW